MSSKAKQKYIKVADDGLYCQVPTDPNEVRLETIVFQIAEKGIIDISLKKLESILRTNRGKRARISGFPRPFEKDKVCKLAFNEDETEAYITIRLTREINTICFFDIVYFMLSEGVRFGFDFTKIEEIVEQTSDRTFFNREVVAVGAPPKPGRDASLEFMFDMENEHRPLIKEDGSVDYRMLDIIQCVRKGDKLAEKNPATKGRKGRTVRGVPIETTDGADISLPAGKNTVHSETEKELLAACNGHVYYQNNKVHVEEIYIVSGDVDFSTGNLYFSGDIIIRGSVRPEFEVSAGGNIEVLSEVEGGILTSKDGSIKVQGGIIGKGLSRISAAKNVEAKFIENARVSAGEDITANNHIVTSKVTAGGCIRVLSGEGVIIGADVSAGREIIARETGKPQTVTRLNLKHPKFEKLLNEKHEVEKKIEEIETLIEKSIETLAAAPSKMAEEMQEVRRKNLKKNQQRLNAIMCDLEAMQNGKIAITKIAREGTRLNLFDREIDISEPVMGNCWIMKDGQLTEEPYKE